MPSETKDAEKMTEAKNKNSMLSRPGREWLYVTAVVAVAVLIYGIGYGAARMHDDDNKMVAKGLFARNAGDGPVTVRGNFSGGTMLGHGSAGVRTMLEDSNHYHGVVTAVNGGNFTIGASGASTEVVTSSSTAYQNGNSVKQNDSVIIEGTKTGDTITATKVIINP